jgi:hypothetical protein
VDVEIWSGAPEQGELIVQDRIAFYGSQQGESQFDWAWDTTGLMGSQTVTVVLDPADKIQIGDEDPTNNRVSQTIELLPRSAMPDAWASAQWEQQTSVCCTFHYVTGTAAERDITTLMETADQAVAYAAGRLGVGMQDEILDVYLIDRVLGHGGFASDVIILSYLDRFYAGGDWPLVFRHEGTHVLDQTFAQVRPSLLVEGLAVYVSGGHYREEPLMARAAALLELNRYIPLQELADSFYPSQHEIGYLEAGSFVAYLVDRFGWERFKAFYGDIPRTEGGQSKMIDAALQEHFGLTLEEAEMDWMSRLEAVPNLARQVKDLELTIAFYDTLRRYQRAWDHSAYFREFWLPAPAEAERRGITADTLRHPSQTINIALETMFVAADRALDQGAYQRAGRLLESITAVLDADGDLHADALASQYAKLVRLTAAAGYEVQKIDLDQDIGIAWVVAVAGDSVDLVELSFVEQAGVWTAKSWGN